MNKLAVSPPRPERYSPTSYRAFRVCEGGDSYSIDLGDVASLKEALNAASGSYLLHKEHLAIREENERGEVKVYVYAIRRKRAQWVQGPTDYLPKRVLDLYPDPVCVLEGRIFADAVLEIARQANEESTDA